NLFLAASDFRDIIVAIDPSWADPTITRSRVVIEIASEIVNSADQPMKQAMVLLRPGSAEDKEWKLGLFGSNSHEGIEAVLSGRAALAIVNPSAQLALAYNGAAPYTNPAPLRTIAVIPSLDQIAFVVRKDTGLTSFEDIARKRYPLKVSV